MDIFVRNKERQRHERVRVDDIIYVETGGAANIIIHTSHGSYTFSTSLNKFLAQYQSSSVVQLHQSYVVNWDKVVAVTRTAVFVNINGEERALKVGRLEIYRERFATLVNKLRSE